MYERTYVYINVLHTFRAVKRERKRIDQNNNRPRDAKKKIKISTIYNWIWYQILDCGVRAHTRKEVAKKKQRPTEKERKKSMVIGGNGQSWYVHIYDMPIYCETNYYDLKLLRRHSRVRQRFNQTNTRNVPASTPHNIEGKSKQCQCVGTAFARKLPRCWFLFFFFLLLFLGLINGSGIALITREL